MARAESEPCALLPWDSEFWGVRIGRVSGRTLSPASARAVDDWAAENGMQCLYFLASSDDVASAHAAEDAGFRLMDARVELVQSVGSADPASRGRVRPARAEDAAALRALARTSHETTRFYADPNFSDERCADLYDVWITRSLDGWADAVFVAEWDGGPAGYITCHADEEARTGSLGLMAVEPRVRGRGLGAALVEAAVGWLAERGLERIEVVVQGRNLTALRLFERSGFLVSSLDLWFHKWYAE